MTNRKTKQRSRLKKTQSVSGKAENSRHNRKRKSGNSGKRFSLTEISSEISKSNPRFMATVSNVNILIQ